MCLRVAYFVAGLRAILQVGGVKLLLMFLLLFLKPLRFWGALTTGNAISRPEVSTEAVMRSSRLCRRLKQLLELIREALQFSRDGIGSVSYFLNVCCEADLMLENARWRTDCLDFRIDSLAVCRLLVCSSAPQQVLNRNVCDVV